VIPDIGGRWARPKTAEIAGELSLPLLQKTLAGRGPSLSGQMSGISQFPNLHRHPVVRWQLAITDDFNQQYLGQEVEPDRPGSL